MRQILATLVVLLFPLAAYAQEASISGTINDQTGGVLPGVTITATHVETGNTFVGVTDERGTFRLPLRVGNFRIAVELSGFTTINRTIDLLLGQTAVVNLTMAPSTIQESVTVTGEAPLIDTTSSSLGSNIDPRQMQELPVNGRNWVDLTLLAAGSRQNAVNETPVSSGGTTVRFDASQGHSSGVQVNAITKSGTNTPGGSFSGYFRSDKFNAADPVTHTVLPYSDQQLSVTFGGPIIRDRFHYFGSFEYEREPQTYVYTTPYPKFNGSLTGTRTERKEIARFDYQFSPKTRLTLRGTRYDNLLPYDPRYTGGSDRTMASAIGTNRRSEQELATITRVLGARAVNEIKAGHDVFHWNQYSHTTNANSLPGMTTGLGAPVINLRGFTLGQSHNLTPQDIGEEEYTARDDFSFSYTAHGRHDLKAGAEYMRNFLFETVCNSCMGNLDLQGGAVPANIESLIPNPQDVSTWNLAPLSPLARQYSRGIAMEHSPYSRPAGNNGFTEYAPKHDSAFWLQDDWKIAPKLTLNLGVRYDLSWNQFVQWVVYPPFLPAPRKQDLNNWGPRVGFAYSLDEATVIRGGYGKYYAAVTSQLTFTLRTVQTISPQILYDGRPDFAVNPFNGPAPTYEQAARLLCAVNNVTGCLRPNIGNMVADDLQQPYSYQGSIGMARQIGPQMSVEADYIYIGDRASTRTTNLNLTFNPATGGNYPFTGGGADVTRRVYPDYGTLSLQRTDGKGNNHALQMALTKRLSHNWQASANYSFQTQYLFDNLPIFPGCQYPMTIVGNGKARCDVAFTLAPDISEGNYYLAGDQRHRVTFNGIWQLPYGFQWSGAYLFGDNGKDTPTSGVDTRAIGNSGGRLRANSTLIERNSFDRKAIQRVDMRIQRRFKLGGKAAVDGILEVFNPFNRANINSWVINESNARFGQPQQDTNVAYAPRMLQVGFRATF